VVRLNGGPTGKELCELSERLPQRNTGKLNCPPKNSKFLNKDTFFSDFTKETEPGIWKYYHGTDNKIPLRELEIQTEETSPKQNPAIAHITSITFS
jgi:hypothetical protein